MSKAPCFHCRNKGMATKPCTNTKEWVQVVACRHCGRFTTDLEAARWYFNKPKVVEFDGAIAIVVREADCASGRAYKV